MENPIRVAQVLNKMDNGGIEAVVLNYYKFIDKSKIQFDFICSEDSTIPYEKEIIDMGGRIFKAPPLKKMPQYINYLRKLFKTNQYKIVHVHMNTLSVFPLFAAKLVKVPVRICHNHSTLGKGEYLKNLLKIILRPTNKLFANKYFSCSVHSGVWMYGKHNYDSKKIYILFNAVDIERFQFNKVLRDEIRANLHLNNKIVLGCFARFCFAKNQQFLIELISKMQNPEKYILLLIGDGAEKYFDNYDNIKNMTNVKILQSQKDIYRFYNALDIFLFPSKYEGLGMVAIEAQINNLPTIASTHVPLEVKISNQIDFISLNCECWIKAIENVEKQGRNYNSIIDDDNYDIKKAAFRLSKLYYKFLLEGRCLK